MYLSQSHLKIKTTVFGAMCDSMSPPLLQLPFQKGSFKKILLILPLTQPYYKAPSTSVVLYSL